MASLTFLNKSSISSLISILLCVWCVNLTRIVAWAEKPWPCLSQLLLLLGYFWAGKVRWMSLIQVGFVCLRAMSCSCAAGVCFTGENRQKFPLQSFCWGCNAGTEWGVIFTSLLLYYFASYCRSCQPLVPFPGKKFSVCPSLLDLTRCFLLQSRLQERQKKPNRKLERDHMGGLLKTPPNKCLWQREFSVCAVLFQVPWEEACLIDWGHSWLYWKMEEWINKALFKQTKQEKSKTHLLGTRSNAVCFDPLFAQ